MLSSEKIVKSTQEQAVAAWIDYLNVLRLHELAEKLARQDINFETAMAELQKLKIFVSDPSHILGFIRQKHGEIAEHVQVAFMNAERFIVGQEANHTFDGVGRLAPEDYLRSMDLPLGKIPSSIPARYTFGNSSPFAL